MYQRENSLFTLNDPENFQGGVLLAIVLMFTTWVSI